MKCILLLSFFVLVAVNAIIDAKRIKNGKAINHTLEYIMFLLASIITVWGISKAYHVNLSIAQIGIIGLIGSTLARLAGFNQILYYMRDLPYDYESKTTTSIIDQWIHTVEKKLSFVFHDWYISAFFIVVYILLFFVEFNYY